MLVLGNTMQLLCEFPLNNLSFGNVSYNILRELWKKDIDVGLFPIGEPDLSAFEPKKEFVEWIQNAINKRFSILKRDIPSLKLWHIQGSDSLKTPNQHLLTFYECSSPSDYERSIVGLQKKTLFSSRYAAEKFGGKNVDSFICGFDPDFHNTGKNYGSDKISFFLGGKWESRKATGEIIKAWVKKYGNNPKYCLNLMVHNPFFKPEDNQRLLNNAFGGKRIWNCNVIPPLRTNREVNEVLNASDIDLSGLSRSEGWGLFSFNMTALGKQSVVANHTSHKDWATENNSILVEPDGEIPVYDGVFFKQDSPVNHGIFYTVSEDKMIAAMELAEKKARQLNISGLVLQQTHSWSSAVDGILNKITEKTNA